jgi:hypothetical protein
LNNKQTSYHTTTTTTTDRLTDAQPLHHKDTGQQGVALLASLPPAKTLPTTSDLVSPTIRKSDTTLLAGLHILHGKQLAQLTSTAAPDITTATGRTFFADL